MLKYGREVLTKLLKLLFNHVILSGGFPSAEKISWLKPPHKGGKTTSLQLIQIDTGEYPCHAVIGNYFV